MTDEIKPISQDTSTPQQIETNKLYDFVKDYIKESVNKKVDKKFEDIRPQIESKVDSFVSEFKKEINKVKNNVINTLAIFAAFFTFIATSFNIFSLKISIYSAMSLAVILWLLLIGFAYLVNLFIARDHTSIKAWIPVIVLAILSLIILFSNLKYSNDNLKINNTKEIINKNIK